MFMLLGQMDDGFWQKKRKEQFIALLERSRGTGIIQKDIAAVLAVSNTSATRFKRQHDQHPENLLQSPGRPSQIGEVFDKIKNVKNETENDHSVTLSVLMEYVTNDLHIETTKKVLLQFMKNHGFSNMTGLPTEDARVNLYKDKLEAFYTTTLPESLRGVHPSLVFNMDEMGAERYADRKGESLPAKGEKWQPKDCHRCPDEATPLHADGLYRAGWIDARAGNHHEEQDGEFCLVPTWIWTPKHRSLQHQKQLCHV